MTTILVPTDFSNYALFALKVAANITRKIKAEIELVHVCNLLSVGAQQYHYYYAKYNKEIIQNANEKLNELIGKDFLKDVAIKKHIISDMLMWEAVTDERFKNVDLIVMGSHGTGGFSNLFLGSNTEKIVRLADPPVLTIKNDIKDFTIKKMVFASNFLEENYKAFEKVKLFADLYNAHVDLLKVITPKNFESTPISQKLIEDFIKKFNLKNYSINIYNAHNIEKGIIDFSDVQDADLIAMETHGRTGFAHLINGSLAEDVLNHEALPVLSVKIIGINQSIL
ncbi:universal stress protein [Draconibacterium sp.]|nr:universal stress protein [Draconibacterium sp.]